MVSSIFIKWFLALSVVLATGSVGFGQDFKASLSAYDNGDYVTALREFRLLAEQGDAAAQYNLGVIRDRVYAHMWVNIAVSRGNESSRIIRDIIAGDMTAAQIAKAQELARECVKKQFKGC